MATTKEPLRFEVKLYVDGVTEDVEAKAFAYPCLSRPVAGAMPKQELATEVEITLSAGVKATLKTEIKTAVDAKVAE